MLISVDANPGKFQFMILDDNICYEHIFKINLICVYSSDDETLMIVTTDKSLTFKKHIDNLVCKAQYKLHALMRVLKFLTVEKAKILGHVLETINSIMHLSFECSVANHFTRKSYHKTLKVIYVINDSYNNLLLRNSV